MFVRQFDHFTVSEFRGSFPAVEIDTKVDVSALTVNDDDPFYVTLPIARVGETSGNGLLYDDEIVAAIQAQVIGKGGIMGHIKDEDRDSSFPIEDVDWVGTTRQENTLWGKGYVPPGETREFIRRLKARGGSLATSIYGPYDESEPLDDGSYRLRGFRLESLDLAPADRAALKLGGEFAVTAQMQTNESDSEDSDMPTKDEIIAELNMSEVPQIIREQIIQDWQSQQEGQDRVAELEQQVEDGKTLNAELQKQIKVYKDAEYTAVLDGQIAELIDWNVTGEDATKKVDAFKRTFRARVVTELGDNRKEDKIKETVKSVWTDEMEFLAETLRDALAGPPALVGAKNKTFKEFDTSPEAIAEARRKAGI